MLIRALRFLRCLRKTDRGPAIARVYFAPVILLLFVAPSLVFGQGSLTNVTATPSNSAAGAGTIYTINFTNSLAGVVPNDGKIRLTFPAGFDVANVSLAQNISGLSSGYATVSPAGQVVTLTRDGFGAALPGATPASFRIAVVNNATLAAGFRVFVETLTNADALIDSATSAIFNIVSGQTQRFAFDAVSTVTAGVPFNLVIRAKDIYNNTVTSFTGTLSLFDITNTLNPPTAVIASNGTVTVSNATITKAQTSVLITAVSGSLNGTSNAFNVVHGPLDHFAVTSTSGGIIGSQVAGAPFNIRLVAQDVYKNTVTAFTGNVTLSNTTSSVTPTTSGNFSSGVLASQQVTINKIASADSITASGGAPVKTGSSNGFFVGSGNLAGFQIDPVSSPQTAGVPFPVRVRALDANGNTATDFTGTVNFSLTGGSLIPAVSGNFVAGVWNGNLTVLTSGTGKIINVTDGTFNISSNAFAVNPAAAASFAVTDASDGNIVAQTAGTNFSIKITAKDANGNVATGFTGTVELADNTGTLTPGAATITTGGTATVNVNITHAQASVSISAKSGSLTGASNIFTVNPAALDHFVVTNTSNGSIGTQQAGTPFNIKIVAQDFFNNIVTSFNGTVALSNATNSISPATSGNFAGGVLASQSVTITKASATDAITVIPQSGTAKTGSSNNFVVNAGNLAGFVVSNIPSPQTAGVPFPLTITAVDANQNTVTGFAGTVNFLINSGNVIPGSSSNFVAGVWNGNVAVSASGSGKIITVTDGVRQTVSNAFNVNPGGLDHFFIPSIGAQSAGKNFTVTVTAKDANDNDVSHTGIVTLSDNTGSLTASILAFTGQATQSVTDVKIKKTKSDAVITANGSGKSGSSNAFAVNAEAGTLDHFVVTNTSGGNINSPQTAGVAFNVKIVAQDQFDNTATDFNGSVTITDLGTLNLTSANFVSGELASQSVTINQARLDNQLTVTGGSPARTGASNLFNVIAGGVAGFTIDQVSDQATNEPFSITIRARDANGNLATSFGGTVTISDLTGTITPTASLQFTNGVRNESVKISQTRTGDVITVSSAGKTGNSNAFNVTAATVDHFVINTINNQTAGQPFPITITAQDASNNPVTSFTGTVTLSDLSGSIAPATSNPFTSGTLTQNFAITKSFTNDRVTVTGLGKSNASNPFNVIAGNLDHFAIAFVPNQTAGVSFPITITAQDVNDNTVTSFGGTVTIVINPGSITPAVSGTFANGVRIESVTVPAVGNNRVITVNDGSGHTGPSNAFNVTAGGLDHFVFNPIATQTAGLPFSFIITAKDFNNNDVSFTGPVTFSDNTGTLSPTSVAMNGVSVTVNNAQITKAQTGVVITATGGGKTGASSPFTVNPGALSRVRIVQGTGGGPGTEFTTYNMTADDQLPLHAAGYDALGNYISDPPVSWVMQAVPPSVPPLGVVSPAASSSFTTFSANKVGALKIIADHATASVVDDTTGNITIAVGAANSVRVLQTAFGNTPPLGNVSLNSGDPLPMHASSFDADGNRIGDVSVTWVVNGSMGFVNPTSGTNTTFNATTAGSGTVTAVHATLNSGSTGTITVSTSTLSFIRIMDGPSGNTTQVGNRTVRTNETLPVHAAGFDVNGNYRGDVDVTWNISNPIGTLSSSSGINTTLDPRTPGTGVITATHATAGNASTGTITVITGPAHHIKVLKGLSGPAPEATSDSLFTGETRDFHASSFDIDDNRLGDVSVTWNVSGGIGTLNPLSGASTTLTASTVGFGVITAQHTSLGSDQTGVIKVKSGSLSYVRVVEGPSGVGQKLGATSRNTDQVVTVHAAGFDVNNNYLGDQPVTWSVIGNNIGTLDNLNGTSTTLTLRTPGVGRIVADHASANDDTSGAITVSVGALRYVKVLTGDQNETAVVTDHSMNADETFIVHAGGYDADDNYIGDEPANWTVTGGIGVLAPSSGISTTLNARKVGNGQIKADHANPTVTDGLTGTITVTPGALAFIKVVEGATGPDTPAEELGNRNITADDVLQLHAAGFDADSNYVGDKPANWSSAGNLTPVVTGTNVTSIAFAPTLSPASGTIRATHASAGFDDTGLITVDDGALRKIKILADPNGEKAEVGATTLTSGQTLDMHAAGFDADDNYINDLSANWSLDGQIGSVAPAGGISTTFTAGAAGTGTIRATAGSLSNVTGTITVIPGGVAKIVLRTAPNNGGAPFNNLTMTADQDVTVYAAGYDVGNTYRGDFNVTWTSTGNLTPAVSATGSAFTFSPTLANANGSVNGQIIGAYSPTIKDSTGTITVLPGNPSGTISLVATPAGLPSDGTSTSTITTTSAIKDADGNNVGAGKRFTATLAPNLGAIISPPDLDPGTPDVQIETDASSQLNFVFRAGTTGGIVNVNVVSLSGATGSTPISLGSIRILSVTTSPTTVSRGQTGISVSMLVQNVSSVSLTEVTAGLTFTGSADRTGEYTFNGAGNPTTLAGNSTATFSFIVNVGANATPETVTLNGTVSGKVNGTPVSASNANQTDTWTVQLRAALNVTSVTAAPDTVAQGQTGIEVRVRVANNLGQANSASATVDSVRLVFKQGALIKTSEYIVGLPTGPASIAGNSEAEYTFLVNVGSAATLGLITIDARAHGKEGNTGSLLADTDAAAPDNWRVIEGNVFSSVTITPSQNTVTAGMAKPWQVRMELNNAGSSPIQLNLAADKTFIRFTIGSQNVTSQYTIVSPAALDEGGTALAAGNSRHLTFGINPPTGSTLGTATISGFAEGRDQAGQTVTDNTNDFGAGAVTVQSPGTMKIDRIDVSKSPVTANRGTDWTITATVTNEGESEVQLDSMNVTAGNNVGYIFNKPSTFKDGTSVLGTRETKLLDIVVDQTGSQTGILPIAVTLKGTETNSNRLVTSTGVSGSINVQSQAALEIASVTPSRASVTTNQAAAWSVTVAVRNNGGSQVTVKSDSSTNLRFRIGTFQSGYTATLQSAPTIGAGQTANLVFQITTTGANPGTATLVVKVAATETNSGIEVIDTDNSGIVLVQSPPNVSYITGGMQPTLVNIRSSYAFKVRVHNVAGASTVVLNPANTRFRFSGGPANFVATLDANFVQSIPAGDTTLTFVAAPIPDTMPINTYRPVVELRGTENGNPFSRDLTVTDDLRVTAQAKVQIESVQPSQTSVTAGMTKRWNVVVRVANNGGFQVRLDSVSLQLINGIDRKSEYDITYPTRFIVNGQFLPAGATDSLRFIFNRTGTTTGATSLTVLLFVTDQSNGQQISPPPFGNSSFNVQSAADVKITAVTTSQPTVTANRTKDWTITATVTNEGGSAISLHPVLDSLKVRVGNDLGYRYVKPATFTDGSNLLGGGQTKTLAITVDQTGSQTGILPIRVDLKGFETNSNRLVASTGVSGSINVQSAADLQIVSVTPSRATVTTNQTTAWNVTVAVQNNGDSQVIVKNDASSSLRFRIGGQFQNDYSVTQQSAPTIGAGATANVIFRVNTTGANFGPAELWVTVAATETNSDTTLTVTNNNGSVVVQTPPSVAYIDSSMLPDVVNIGSFYAFTIRVRNAANASTVELDPANTKFSFSDGSATFVATLDANPGKVQRIAPGDTTLTFVSTQIPAGMQAGTYTPVVELRGTENGNPFSGSFSVTPNELQVTSPAKVAIVSVQPSQSTVTERMTKHWDIKATVANNGGFSVRLDSVKLRLFSGSEVTSEYTFTEPTVFVSGNPTLAAGATDTLRFDINVTGNTLGNITAQVRLFVTDQSNNLPIIPAPEGNTNFLVQSRAVLKITSITPSQPTVTRNQTQQWHVDMSVTNSGQSDVDINFNNSVTGISFGFSGYTIQQPATFLNGSTRLLGDSTGVLRFLITQTGSQTGRNTITGRIAGTERNSNDPRSDDTNDSGSGSVLVQAPAQLRIDTVRVVSAPNAPFVNLSQPFGVRLVVRNPGEETADNVRVRLTTNGGSQIIPAAGDTAGNIGGGLTKAVTFSITAANAENLSGEIFRGSILGATAHNTGTSITPQTALDDTAVVVIQRPANLVIEKVVASRDTVDAGQSTAWFIYAVVRNSGTATLTLDTPRRDSLRIVIDGAQQTDYGISVDSLLSQNRTLRLAGGESDTLRFTVTSTGKLGGNASLIVSLAGHDRNDSKPVNAQLAGQIYVRTTATVRLVRTDPVVLRPLINGIGFVNGDQVFNIKLTVENTGFEDVKDVVVRLQTDGPSRILTPEQTILAITARQEISFQVEADTGAVAGTPPEIFTARVVSALTAQGNQPASISAPLDSTAQVVVQRPARLSVTASIEDNNVNLSTNQLFTFSARVTNSGQAPVDGSGLVKLIHPADFNVTGAEERAFTVDSLVTWQVQAPAQAIDVADLVVQISKRAVDLNSQGLAELGKDADTLTVKVVQSDIRIVRFYIDSPDGAKDSTLSTDQKFVLKADVVSSQDLKNGTVTLTPPAEYIVLPPADTSKTLTQGVTNQTVTWDNVQAPPNANTVRVYFQADASGINGRNEKVSSSARVGVVTVYKASPSLASLRITDPPGAENGTISSGQTFTIEAKLENEGDAGIKDTVRVRLELGTKGFTTTEDVEKPISLPGFVTWQVKAPNVAVQDSITVRMSHFPVDENSDQIVNVPLIKRLKRQYVVIDSVRSNVRIASFKILAPAGATDDTLSTGQRFTVRAQVEGKRATETNVELSWSPGVVPLTNANQRLGDLEDKQDVDWSIIAPSRASIAGLRDFVQVKITGKDKYDKTKSLAPDSTSIDLHVVDQARLAVVGEISSPPSAREDKIVSLNSVFTIVAKVGNSGRAGIRGAAHVELKPARDPSLSPEEDYRTASPLRQDLVDVARDSAVWVINARSKPSTGLDDFTVQLLRPDPSDQNTDSSATVEIRQVTISVQTEPKRLLVQMLPHPSAGPVVQGEQSTLLMRLKLENEGNRFSSNILLRMFTLHVLDRNNAPLNANSVIKRLRVMETNSPTQQVLGSLATIPAADSLKIPFAPADTLFGGVPDSVDVVVDIADNNASGSAFRLAFAKTADVDAIDQESREAVEIVFLDERGNNVTAEQVTSQKRVINTANFDKSFYNYPNPFSPVSDAETKFYYYLSQPSDIELRIYTLLGELVYERSFKANDPAGRAKSLSWNGYNGKGDPVLNGVYIAILKTSAGTAMTKVAVVK